MGKNPIAGAWRLVEFEIKTPEGEIIYPFGKECHGVFISDENGYTSVQVMQANRSKFTTDPPSPKEICDAFSSYLAYYGRGVINEENKTVATHVEGSLNPDWIGTDQIRNYKFEGDRLVLTIPEMEVGDLKFTGAFSWEK